MKKVILLCLLCLLSFADTVDKRVYANGQLAILEFDKESLGEILNRGVNIPILEHPTTDSKNIIMVPISYYQKGSLSLTKIFQNSISPITIEVKPKEYKKELLSVDSSKVTPPSSQLNRIRAEGAEAKKIYQTFTKQRYWSKPFILPQNSTITSEYGNARVFNGELKSFHGGTDFRAAIGTPIFATNDGVVVLSKERYYSGGAVIIDHGEGVYSCYFHLSQMLLSVGQRVKRGDVIGLSGNSGRVTGPHLHFTLMIQGVSVDPILAIKELNSLFK